MRHLKRELKNFRKLYQSQLINTVQIVRKLRSVHQENKRLQATVDLLEGQLKLEQLVNCQKAKATDACTQTELQAPSQLETSPKVLKNSYRRKQMSSPRSPILSDFDDRRNDATRTYGLRKVQQDGQENSKGISVRQHHPQLKKTTDFRVTDFTQIASQNMF